MRVVTAQELRDLWLGGRGLVLTFAFSLLLSVVAYLVATNRGLNFLEHRETVNLLTPVSRLELTVGKLLGARSLWAVAFLVAIPYVWFLARGVGFTGDALLTG